MTVPDLGVIEFSFKALVPDVHRTGFFWYQKNPVLLFGHNFILRLSFDFKSVL